MVLLRFESTICAVKKSLGSVRFFLASNKSSLSRALVCHSNLVEFFAARSSRVSRFRDNFPRNNSAVSA